MRKNEEYKVHIERLGVAVVEGFTVLTESALPGDYLRIKIISAKKNYAFGKILEIINPSPHRIEPPCPAFPRCGGCSLMHMAYEEQLKYKRDLVYNSLLRIGGIVFDVEDTVGMENPFRYRNKAAFPVRKNGIGFFRKRSADVVNIDDCIIQRGPVKEILSGIRKYNFTPYDETTGKGLLKHIVTRTANETALTLVINGKRLPRDVDLPVAKTIILNINKKKNNVILGDEIKIVKGDGFIYENLLGLKLRMSPLSFFQINSAQAGVICETALEFAELSGGETVIDAYGGIGTIALAFARAAKNVYGIEIVKSATDDARFNAELNGISNSRFITGKSEDVLDSFGGCDVLIADPPRKGCDVKFLETALKIAPRKIIYVSCNPASLARDLKILSAAYEVKRARPIDNFCHTDEIETVVSLIKK
jgi:23S rRNA (uracil1939-C5)-methyltransferase